MRLLAGLLNGDLITLHASDQRNVSCPGNTELDYPGILERGFNGRTDDARRIRSAVETNPKGRLPSAGLPRKNGLAEGIC